MLSLENCIVATPVGSVAASVSVTAVVLVDTAPLLISTVAVRSAWCMMYVAVLTTLEVPLASTAMKLMVVLVVKAIGAVYLVDSVLGVVCPSKV